MIDFVTRSKAVPPTAIDQKSNQRRQTDPPFILHSPPSSFLAQLMQCFA